MRIRLVLFLMLTIVFFIPVFAANVNLSWEPSAEAVGYVVERSDNPSMNAPERIDVGAMTTATIQVPSGGTYYIAVRAYNFVVVNDVDSIRQESERSNVVKLQLPVKPSPPGGLRALSVIVASIAVLTLLLLRRLR